MRPAAESNSCFSTLPRVRSVVGMKINDIAEPYHEQGHGDIEEIHIGRGHGPTQVSRRRGQVGRIAQSFVDQRHQLRIAVGSQPSLIRPVACQRGK